MYEDLSKLPFQLPPKPKAGLYIDDSNLYHQGKASGWMVDYKKIYKWISNLNTVIIARIYMGLPRYEPAKSINEAMQRYFEKHDFKITAKELKRLRDPNNPKGFKNKCNFDVELHDEVMEDLDDLDIVYIASGDSDFLRTKDKVLKKQKHIKFLTYEHNCASEIRYSSWFVSLDSIRDEVERGPHKTEKPDARSGEIA